MSLPVVIIMHRIEESNAWARIMWINAVSKLNISALEEIDRISWSQISQMLKIFFESQSGCRLTDEHIQFLGNFLLKYLWKFFFKWNFFFAKSDFLFENFKLSV